MHARSNLISQLPYHNATDLTLGNVIHAAFKNLKIQNLQCHENCLKNSAIMGMLNDTIQQKNNIADILHAIKAKCELEIQDP